MKELFAGGGIFSVVIGIAWWLIRLISKKPDEAAELAEEVVEIVKAVKAKPKTKGSKR
jgi:hypothetical protein